MLMSVQLCDPESGKVLPDRLTFDHALVECIEHYPAIEDRPPLARIILCEDACLFLDWTSKAVRNVRFVEHPDGKLFGPVVYAVDDPPGSIAKNFAESASYLSTP